MSFSVSRRFLLFFLFLCYNLLFLFHGYRISSYLSEDIGEFQSFLSPKVTACFWLLFVLRFWLSYPPFLGYPVMFACPLTCQRDLELVVGWSLPTVTFAVEASGWAISLQHPVSFFKSLWVLQRNTSQPLAWGPSEGRRPQS